VRTDAHQALVTLTQQCPSLPGELRCLLREAACGDLVVRSALLARDDATLEDLVAVADLADQALLEELAPVAGPQLAEALAGSVLVDGCLPAGSSVRLAAALVNNPRLPAPAAVRLLDTASPAVCGAWVGSWPSDDQCAAVLAVSTQVPRLVTALSNSNRTVAPTQSAYWCGPRSVKVLCDRFGLDDPDVYRQDPAVARLVRYMAGHASRAGATGSPHVSLPDTWLTGCVPVRRCEHLRACGPQKGTV
jgi:hypothetical protein